MPFYNLNTAVTTRTRNVQYWIAHDDRRQEWLAEIIVRRPAGILYLVNRYAGERPARRALYRDACRYGHLSPRPYQLAQPCDGSIGSCVLALFSAFCKSRELDPIVLLHCAYPDEAAYTAQHFAEICRQADWQRTTYPAQWDQSAIAGLIESLHEINYHSLVSVVDDTIAGEGP